MKIKHIKFSIGIFIAVTIMYAITGCKKFISPEPISSFSLNQVFGNLAYAQSAVIGAYNILAGQNYMGLRTTLTFQGDVDDFKGQGGLTGDNGDRDVARYNITSVNNGISAPYSQMYAGIERTNICIAQIPKMPQYSSGTEQEQGRLRRLHGEALTLRALFYFDLIKLWGDVPEQRIPSTEAVTIFLPKTDRDTIYNHILDDLKIAADLVPWRTEISKFGEGADERITKGAVKALRARIALFRGGYSLRRATKTMGRSADYLKFYQIAKEECGDLIARPDQHKLNPSFRAVFKDYICGRNANEPNGDLVFQIAEGGNGVGGADGRIGLFNGTRFGGVGGGSITAMPTYVYYFDSTDTRRDVSIVYAETRADYTKIGRSINQLYDGKWRRDWWANPVNPTLNTLNSALNWPVIRFSDVLLMYAEADNEVNQGPSAEAINAVSEVSRRAHSGNQALVPVIPTDYSNFFKYIVRERYLEFGFECIRKFDLIRWNLLSTCVTETRANLVKLASGEAMVSPTYMAPPPAYSLTANLPKFLYYNTLTSTGDNASIFVNSLYEPAPVTTPVGTSRVNWVASSGITTTFVNEWAIAFKPNHSEIYPIYVNIISASKGVLTQDYDY